jgi:hypothetical protein
VGLPLEVDAPSSAFAESLASNARLLRPQRQKKVDAYENMLRGHEETGTPITYPTLGLKGDEAVHYARGQLVIARRELEDGDRLIRSGGRRRRIARPRRGEGPVVQIRSRAPRRVNGSSGRPGARRTPSAVSSRDGPDDPDPPPSPPLRLAPPPRAIYTFACLSPAERGEAT